MSNSESIAHEAIPPKPVLWAVRVCLVVAAVVALYLLSISLSGGAAVGCGAGSGCDRVLGSRWSKWLGLPVSGFSLVVYLALLGATLRFNRRTTAAQLRHAWQVLVLGSVLVAGAAVWFVVLQLFVTKAICPYCMVAHGCGTIAAILLLRNAPLKAGMGGGAAGEKSVLVSRWQFVKLGAGALALLGVFVLGQAAYEPPGHIEKPIALLLSNQTATAADAGTVLVKPAATRLPPPAETNAAAAPAPPPVTISALPPALAVPPAQTSSAALAMPTYKTGRVFDIYGGQFKFNLDEVPIIGSPLAPKFMVSLFDYTCHHCRSMHERLIEAQRTFADKLAVIVLPMPLASNCNYTVSRNHPDHVEACTYARLGLAVVRADRSKSAQFDEFIFAPERPPPVDEARLFAAQLVGQERLDQALQDPWVEKQIQQDVAIYDLSYRAQRGEMPQSIIGKKIAVGLMREEDLYRLLAEELGLNKPGPVP